MCYERIPTAILSASGRLRRSPTIAARPGVSATGDLRAASRQDVPLWAELGDALPSGLTELAIASVVVERMAA
jgi:hypothetical protein